MAINYFLKENFPNLKLRPPLFYNWDIGIRFELGNPDDEDVETYMKGVYERA